MSDQFSMFLPEILPASRNATSSQELADGPSPCASQAGPMIDQFGPDRPHASLSAQPESNSAKATKDTSPPILSAWSGQPAPLCCLASKSQARLSSEVLQNRLNEDLALRLNGLGSMIYQTDLKLHDTPLGRRIFRLRASARRISVKEHSSERSGWPTPATRDYKGESGAGRQERKGDPADTVPNAAALTGWPTPTVGNASGSQMAKDASTTGKRPDGSKATVSLNGVAQASGWPTPLTGDSLKSGRIAPRKNGMALPETAPLSGWPTPVANDDNKSPEAHLAMKRRMGERDGSGANRTSITSLQVMAKYIGPARRTALGQMLTGCSAEMESGGQLNPAHSRWLMGYPPEWDDCAVMAMQSSPKRRRNSSKPS